MRWRLRLAGGLLGVAAAAYFVVFVHGAVSRCDLRSLGAAPMVVAILAVAVGSAMVIPISSWAWGRLLRGVGIRVPTLRLNMIMGTSQIAKYVPGGIGHHVGRAALSIERGIPAGALLVTLAAETVLAMVAALAVGCLGLAIAARGTARLPPLQLRASALAVLGLVIAAIVLSLLPMIRALPLASRWLAPLLPRTNPTLVTGARSLGPAFAAYVANYLVCGAGLYAIALAAAPSRGAGAALFVGAFALSWIVGFVVPGAPAGMGVREGVLAALLAPPLDTPTALEIIVAFRVATSLGDLLALAWGAGLHLLERRTAARTAAAPSPTDDTHGA